MTSPRSWALALASLVALAGCARRPPTSLVLISVAGLPERPAGEVPPTPRLDSLGSSLEGFRAFDLVSTDLLAEEASLLTGLAPVEHGLVGAWPGESLRREARTLAERAREQGLRTLAFLSALELAAKSGLERGFERWDAAAARAPMSTAGAAREALGSLEPDAGFFLWVELDARDERGRLGGLDEVDQALGALLDELLARGRLESTIVAVVGTRGEPVGASALLPEAVRTRGALRLPPGLLPPVCAASIVNVAPALLRLTGMDPDAACNRQVEAQGFAMSRRFGLPPMPANLRPPAPPPVLAAPAALRAELVRLGLPLPEDGWSLVRRAPLTPVLPLASIQDQELAAIRLAHGYADSARTLYARALEADPLAVEALVEGARLAARAGEAPAAAARLRQALEVYRGRPEIYHALAHTEFLLGRHDRALACARSAALFLPADPDLAFDEAASLAGLGLPEAALGALERAASLGFAEADLLARLPVFAALQGEARFGALETRIRARAQASPGIRP